VSLASAFDVGLALLAVAVAAWTILVRQSLAAVAGFVAYGLLLALAWVRLAAPDVALAEAAIGAGLTGGLLVAAVSRLGGRGGWPDRDEARPGRHLAAAALSLLVAAAIVAVLLRLPDPPPTLAPLALADLARTGLGNPVTAVLMAYRAIDTLLETIVLVLALVGVWSLAPDRFWGGRPGPLQRGDPNGILAYLATLLPPVGVVVGLHVFWTGSDHPGGEFQGATILAAMWILVLLAGLREAPPIGRHWLRLVLVSGPVVFLAIGAAGFAMAGAFLGYPPDHAKLIIVAIEIPVTLAIAAGLALIVVGPPEARPQR
jgi:multisubunit Na+/H+ antiporter MnhB subunit